VTVDEIRRYSGDWCRVTYATPGDDDHTRVQMPREDQHDGAWRFTDKDSGMEFFTKYHNVLEIELLDGARFSAAANPCEECGECHGEVRCPNPPEHWHHTPRRGYFS
jgi:hypothetical protein